jgi:hypothetical protein
MILKRLALLSWVILAFPSAYAQQPPIAPTKDPQAISILQQSVKIMASTIPSDSVASGNIQIVAGSQTTPGTILILTRGYTQSLVQLTTPEMTSEVIYSNGQANEIAAGAVNVLPLELVVITQAPEFPIPVLLALLNDPDTSFQYIGLEATNGLSLQHVRTSDSFASRPDLQPLSSFSTRDIWIDASSGLPQRISYVRRPAHGAVAGVAIDVFYSNYQTSSGVLFPSTIQKSLNGTPWATISIQSMAFNTGLTDSDFPVQ